jgi:hypothetical protein
MGWANLYRPHGTRKITVSTVFQTRSLRAKHSQPRTSSFSSRCDCAPDADLRHAAVRMVREQEPVGGEPEWRHRIVRFKTTQEERDAGAG